MLLFNSQFTFKPLTGPVSHTSDFATCIISALVQVTPSLAAITTVACLLSLLPLLNPPHKLKQSMFITVARRALF